MTAKRALVCSFGIPQTDRDTGSRRISGFIDYLREQGWVVTFLSTNGLTDPRHAHVLQQRGVAVYDMTTISLNDVLASSTFDLALFAYWPVAEYHLPVVRRVSPQTRIIVDSIDLHFLRNARRIFRDTSPGQEGLGEEYGSEMRGELNTYAAADAVLTVSEKEADLIIDLTGDARSVYSVPVPEDLEPSTVPFARRKGIAYVGSFLHPPNVQAVEYLCSEIVPRLDASILDQHPVYVVGSGLNETVRSYCRRVPSVRVVGWVPSVEQYLRYSRISVIPLLNGAGTKGKLIQALMVGTPTVSTSIGVEGLDLRDGEHVMVSDDPESFATSMTRLLRDEVLWRSMSRRGRVQIMKAHGREAVRSRFLHVVESVMHMSPKPPMSAPISREQYSRRLRALSLPLFQLAVREVVPPGATVLVLSEGHSEALRLGDRKACHFPQDRDGRYVGRPADGVSAINHLEALRADGADYLVVPGLALGWLDRYPDFRQHLETNCREVARRKGICVIFALRGAPSEAPPSVGEIVRSRLPMDTDVAGTMVIRGDTSAMTDSTQDHETVQGADRSTFIPQGFRSDGQVRLIAFYLPQYHPIPENDAWWGDGFTEWRNVATARPLFSEHYQPHLPADLGFCDLRLPEIRQAQADLAREYGVHGFCYYHYWFHGKLLLERPFNEVLTTGKPDFPFCLCWVNEPWSRRWDGKPHEILQAQTYSGEDDIAHIRWLIPALADPRAIKIEGKPVILIYHGQELPHGARTVETWREEIHKAGLSGAYVIAVERRMDSAWDATKAGFDATLLFQPQFSMLVNSEAQIRARGRDSLKVYDYQKAWPILANSEPVSTRRYETVFPSWDNSPRVGEHAAIFHRSTSEAYGQWLGYAIKRVLAQPPEHRIVFINAWNEWGEGCHLEPDMRYGRAYLEATRAAGGGGINAPHPHVHAEMPVSARR